MTRDDVLDFHAALTQRVNSHRGLAGLDSAVETLHRAGPASSPVRPSTPGKEAPAMTHRLTMSDYERVAVAVMDGANMADAAQIIGVTDRTLYRRMAADETIDRLLREAVALREAGKERAPCGTRTRYNHGCRCALCREAGSNAKRRQRANNRGRPIPETVKHGTANTYTYWNCRCPACTQANTDYNREYARRYYLRHKAAS